MLEKDKKRPFGSTNSNNSKETRIFFTQISIIFIVTVSVVTLFFNFKESLTKEPENFSFEELEQQIIDESVTQNEEVVYVDEQEYKRELTFNREERKEITFTKPTRITIDSIGIDTKVVTPSSPRVDVLDEALKHGAVYYPGSGTLEEGNIFLFGHSTGFSVVQNQYFKTFNGLNKLSAGDEIKLEAGGKNYLYQVETVTLVDSNDSFIDLSKEGRRLTLSTCHSFGQKSERWVVDAVFRGEV
jgi:LPXTG-site transpeptidase (sortase) family protein